VAIDSNDEDDRLAVWIATWLKTQRSISPEQSITPYIHGAIFGFALAVADPAVAHKVLHGLVDLAQTPAGVEPNEVADRTLKMGRQVAQDIREFLSDVQASDSPSN